MEESLNNTGIAMVMCLKADGDGHAMSELPTGDCQMSPVIGPISTVNLDTNQEVPQILSGSLSTHSVCQMDMDQYVSVEVFDAANEIEINTDGTEGVVLVDEDSAPSLQCSFGLKEDVPNMVAAETVVMTTQPRRRKQKLETQTILQHHETRVVSDDICVSDSTDGVALWGAAIQTDTLYLEHPCSSMVSNEFQNASQVVEVLTSDDIRNLVTLTPDSTAKELPLGLSIPGDMVQEASIRDLQKRERDRLKKRRIREDPTYRLMEKDKSRVRMRLKRIEPGYREKEREKDRNRRRQARQRNDTRRQQERDRDKTYKKNQRRLPVTMATATATHANVSSSYSIDLVDIPSVNL